MKTLPGINFACLNPAGFYPYKTPSEDLKPFLDKINTAARVNWCII
jgi:hypothetical protein